MRNDLCLMAASAQAIRNLFRPSAWDTMRTDRRRKPTRTPFVRPMVRDYGVG
jgi:hypothetical protein